MQRWFCIPAGAAEMEWPMKETGTEKLISLRMEAVTLRRHRWKKTVLFAGVCVWGILIAFLCMIFLGGGQDSYTANIRHVVSYRQIYQYYMDLLDKQDRYVLRKSNMLNAVMGAGDTNGGTAMASASGSTTVQTYTSPNQREKGIGEADVAVTDGKWIYKLVQEQTSDKTDIKDIWGNSNFLQILKPDGENTREMLKLQLPVPEDKKGKGHQQSNSDWISDRQAEELYVYGDILVVAQELQGKAEWNVKTAVYFYDISDVRHPRELGHTLQNGSYNTMREYGGILYLVTQRMDIPVTAMKEQNKERYLPWMDGEFLGTDDIILPEDAQGNAYTIVSTWRLQQEVTRVDTKAMIGHYPDVYMTENNLYLSTTMYADTEQEEKNDRSRVMKFKLREGKLIEGATVVMPGAITNSFAIQERKDKLYVVTQILHYTYEKNADEEDEYAGQWDVNRMEVCAYVFNDTLKLVSKCGSIAENEEVKAVRLMEDVGYVVTYRQTDPLISIDFSDPEKIKVMDELKLPGFSAYLHPVGEDLLLGIGTTDDEENMYIKVALYDISDNKKLRIFDEKLVEDMEYSDVSYDYRRAFVDEKNGIVGFGGTTCNEAYLEDTGKQIYRNTYVLYRYSRDGKLEQIGDYEVKAGTEGMTGMRIGSWFYIIPHGVSDVSDLVIVPYGYAK